MSGRMTRQVQQRAQFTAGDPAAGYYNDLTIVAREYDTPWIARSWLDLFVARRQNANPVSILQLGIGSWQLAASGADDAEAWQAIAYAVARWVVDDLDDNGGLAYGFDMPHTFPLTAPWHSALAQGQAASLLARLLPTAERELPEASQLEADELHDAFVRVTRTLLDDRINLVADNSHGPVLQEYPTSPPSNVLNGWMFALFGLYDAATVAAPDAKADLQRRAGEAFDTGVATMLASLPDYELPSGWTRYDLYPRRMQHVASPFYHALHIELASALVELAADRELAAAEAYPAHIDRWTAALTSRSARSSAVARKVAFRLMHPRRKQRGA